MADITASMVKELREMTGAGMMDCKKALNETNGNMEEAVEYLRKNGQAKAEKKASRIAAEGLCAVVMQGDTTAAVVEVNSETDFVAKNADFQAYVKAVADQAVASDAADMDAFMAEAWNLDASKTVKEALVEKIAVIGENLNIRRFEKVVATNGCVVSYVHGGGRIGVIVEADTDVVNDAVKEAMSNIAMQVAALSPKYVSTADVSEEYKAHEMEILKAQIAADPKMAGKSDKVIEGAVVGRLNKELKEVCLLEQAYVKAEDGKQTVAQYIAQVAKENSANFSIKKFVRFETGEGIEKKEENFAEEVAKQMAGK
ncbi:MAG: elongation factor Ts [Lachnospiraceae bacterium]|nr:elongation factor Ts [Lachnospiraceae bacterium]